MNGYFLGIGMICCFLPVEILPSRSKQKLLQR